MEQVNTRINREQQTKCYLKSQSPVTEKYPYLKRILAILTPPI